jgi:sodium transport system permease protein
MLLIFYIGTLVQQRSPLWGVAFTEWGLILLPVLASLWYARVDLRQTLRLHAFSFAQGLGAVVMALSMLTLVMGFSAVHDQFLPIPDSMKEGFAVFLQGANSWPGLIAVLLAMALSPALCEEALFRGALLSGLRQRMRPLTAVLTVAVLFGAFHLSIYRFAPTALLGLAITYAVLRTNSLWIGVLIHLINNSLAILLGAGRLPKPVTEFLMPPNWETAGPSSGVIAAAFIGLLLGVALLEAATRSAKRKAAVLP